jgi:hypothetical protein
MLHQIPMSKKKKQIFELLDYQASSMDNFDEFLKKFLELKSV